MTYRADLSIDVSDSRGSTTILVGNDSQGVVVDIDDPGVALRCVPGRALTSDLPVTAPPELFAGTSVRLTSKGRDLGRARLNERGRLRFAPTPVGAVVLGRAAGGAVKRPSRPWLVAAAVAVVTAVVVWVRRTR